MSMPEVYMCAHCHKVIHPDTEEYVKWHAYDFHFPDFPKDRVSHAVCMVKK